MRVRRDVSVVLCLWLITVVGQASVRPATEVRISGGRIHIQASAVPVSEVLDRLSRTTGMKVVYDGAPPTDRLTAAIDAGSETEALSRLLEGLGLTYAFKLDAAGRHVETLFVTSATRRASASSSGSPAPPRLTQVVGEDYELNGVQEEPEPTGDPAAMGGPPGPDGMPMASGSPGYAGANPGYAGGVGGQAPPGVEDPAFPGAASFPNPGGTVPATPEFPVFPGPASYP